MVKKIVFITLMIFVYGCSSKPYDISFNNVERPSFETGIIRIETNRGEFFDINAEIAKTLKEQKFGLMYIKTLDTDNGMWFPYDKERILSFWMKHTYIPLDIIFIDKKFRIVDIKRDFSPCKTNICESYTPKVKAQYVLEVNGGYTSLYDINIGDKVYPILIDH